jgi:hypothetical protein
LCPSLARGDREDGGGLGDDDSVVPKTPGIAVLFGTHNWKSSRLVLDEIQRVGLGRSVDDKIVLTEQVRQRVFMAQLYGKGFPLLGLSYFT